MTYGWAILIIAVVLGVMFQLGLFSSSNLAPKAPAGACQVFRPAPGVAGTISLEGECSGELPEYVAVTGSSAYVTVPSTPSLSISGSFTLAAWVYPTCCASNGNHDQPLIVKGTGSHPQPGYELFLGYGTDYYVGAGNNIIFEE